MLYMIPRLVAIALMKLVLNYTVGPIPKELKPEHNLLAAHPTIRTDLLERLRTGTITPHRGSIKKFTKKGVELTNGEIVEPLDVVVAATGYSVCLPPLNSRPRDPDVESAVNNANS